MSRTTMRVWVCAVGMVTSACPRTDDPTPPDATVDAPASTPAPAVPEASPTPPQPPSIAASPPADPAHTLTILEVDATAGALDEQLTIFAARAKSEGRIATVELWAGWCEPCKKLDRLIGSGPVTDALAGTVLIRVDVDMFDDELSALGFTAPQIPSLYRVDGRGRPQGKPLSGADWAKRSEVQIAEALRRFLGR